MWPWIFIVVSDRDELLQEQSDCVINHFERPLTPLTHLHHAIYCNLLPPHILNGLRRYGKYNRQEDGAVDKNKPPIPALPLPRNACYLYWRTPRLRSTRNKTNSRSGDATVQVHGLVQRMVAHAYHLLELKSDGKIPPKSASRRRRMGRLGLREDGLVSPEQTASDRKRTFRTYAVVRAEYTRRTTVFCVCSPRDMQACTCRVGLSLLVETIHSY